MKIVTIYNSFWRDWLFGSNFRQRRCGQTGRHNSLGFLGYVILSLFFPGKGSSKLVLESIFSINHSTTLASGAEPNKIEARLYNRLFKSDHPASLDNFLEDLNPNSLEVVENAYSGTDILGKLES